jgi:Flp pilus assembly protein TadG
MRGDLLLKVIKRIARRLTNTHGAEIAEVALVLPLVFMFLLGIIWFGRAFNIYSTIAQAAQQGAIVAARASCATCSTPNTFPAPGTVNGPTSTVAGTIGAVMKASSIDPTQIPVNSNPPAPTFCTNPPNPQKCTIASNISICPYALLNPPASVTQPAQCGVIVSFQYPFQFYLPFTSLNFQKITLTAQAQSRMED